MLSTHRQSLARVDHLETKNKVIFYLNVQRFDAAEKLLKATIVHHKDNAGLLNLLGLTYHKQSRFPDAIKQFKLALTANPNYLEAALNLISTLCDLSRYDEAREQFSKLGSTVDERLKIPHLVMGRLANQHAENARTYSQAGLIDQAIQEYQKAISLFPNMTDVRLALATIYFESALYEKARDELELLMQINPEMPQALNLLGLIYYKVGREDLAKQAWTKSTKVDPEDLASRVLIRASQNWQAGLT